VDSVSPHPKKKTLKIRAQSSTPQEKEYIHTCFGEAPKINDTTAMWVNEL
jgi:hypothetical protein